MNVSKGRSIRRLKFLALTAGAALLFASPAFAQSQQGSSYNPNASMMNYYFSNNNSNASSNNNNAALSNLAGQAASANSVMQSMQSMMQASQNMQGMQNGGNQGAMGPAQNALLQNLFMQQQQQQQQQQIDLGSADDPNSPKYKANKLGAAAERQREEQSKLKQGGLAENGLDQEPPPPEVTSLQNINQTQAGKQPDITDDTLSKEIALDMRKGAQKEAALSYGARGGLAKRNYEIMERMRGFDTVLDKVFNFRSLLVKAPSGLLIEPPIIKESDKALVIADGGDEAAVADKVFDINKKAKIVSAPRDWRQYLIQSWSEVPPPPRVLWPRTPQEQADWSSWVGQGWQAGLDQADQIFESNVNQLVADYNGMVRYRMLLAQEMISAPYAMHEDRGVVGDGSQMRVGDRAVRITGPSKFLTKAELWKPADR